MLPFEGLQGLPRQHGKVPTLSEGTAEVMDCEDTTTAAAAKESGGEQDWPWSAKAGYTDPDCVSDLSLTVTPSVLPQ